MRASQMARRLAVCGFAALAGLLWAANAHPAAAADGLVRVSDKQGGVVQTSHSEACTTSACASDGCDSGCKCGPGCQCGSGCGKKGFFGKLFGHRSDDCRCGSGCPCKGGHHLADLNGDGNADHFGKGICRKCGSNGDLFGHGYCGVCCGFPCLPGVPCFGIPVPGCMTGGALGGCYSRVYAVNPYHHDFRDGAVYAAQGYNAPIAVPLAPNVDYQWNYGWGVPSSRLTPVSRVVPSPYAVPPTYTVPPGYVPAGAEVNTESNEDSE